MKKLLLLLLIPCLLLCSCNMQDDSGVHIENTSGEETTQENGENTSGEETTQSNASRGSLAEQEDKLIPAEELVVNEKGWLMGFDNRRINVVVDKDAQLSMNGQIIVEASTYLYDENGNFVGNVWSVGETKKMYILNHGDYEVSNTTFAKIEYMNNGYYEKIVEYSEVEKDACFTIGNYDLKTVSCEIVSAGSSTHVPATKNYTAEELTAKNQ